MSPKLHLCGPETLDRLLPMVSAFHAEMGFEGDDAQRRAALGPLLEGSPYGAVYLIGPERAPVGYLAVTFTWSVEFGGLESLLDEIWVRPAVRGRGMAAEALASLVAELRRAGVRAMSLEAETDSAAERFYTKVGFEPRARYRMMSLRF